MGSDSLFLNLVVDMPSMRVRILVVVIAGLVSVLGAERPASAQLKGFGGGPEPDLSGSWLPINQEDSVARGAGPEPVDYTGLALNDEGKALALSASVSRNSMTERQCAMYPPQYLVFGPFGMKIWPDTDPITGSTVAYHIGAWEDRVENIIWLDGRPHPSENAPHTRSGFQTGQWSGNTLTTHTTHIKMGIIRRNGAQVSDRATLTTHYVLNGDLLTILMFIEDPVYLSEPQTISKEFRRLDRAYTLPSTGHPCTPVDEGTDLSVVPHFLPGENPMVGDLQKNFGIPREATLGGAETMYPEYRKKLKAVYVRPEKCLRMCRGGGPPEGAAPGVPPPR